MNAHLTLPQLESYLWGAAVILRGLVDAGDYKQFIFPLVFYKRLSDVWDEDYAAALATHDGNAELARAEAGERFVIPDGAHWSSVRQLPKDIARALQTAMRAIEAANPGRFDGIFGDAPWTNKERLPDHTLKNLLEHFSTLTLSIANVPEDTLGDAYEYLIGRFAILFPHGVLFRQEEREMRRKLLESDRLDCVLGLGPNLFFNSPMEACVVICRTSKPPERQGRVLFIDAVNEIARERAYSFLKPEHQQRIGDAYHRFADQPGFCHVAEQDSIAANGHSLSIPLYVKRHEHNAEAGNSEDQRTLREVWDDWEDEGRVFWRQMDALVDTLDGLTADQPDSNAKSHSSMRRARCPTTET